MAKNAFRLGGSGMVILLALVVLVPAVYAGIKPCCEYTLGGVKSGKFCTFDSDCPDACTGGAHHGQSCASANCPDACVGGKKHGDVCSSDGDCPGQCSLNSTTCFTDADCAATEGGTCGPVGSCSNIGTCGNDGTCTGQCLSKGKGPKPDARDPVNAGDAGEEEALACFEPARP